MNAHWYFDFISPFSYLQLRKAREWNTRSDITPVPIAFGAVLKHHGQLGQGTVLSSATGLTIPAGRMGILGLYLRPSGQLPAPGTQVSFTVIATSTTNPAVTQTQDVKFTVPAIDAGRLRLLCKRL